MEQIYEHKRMMLLTTLFRHISDHSLCEELYSIQEEVTVTKYRPNTKDIYAHTLVGMGFWWYDTSNKQEVPNYGQQSNPMADQVQ
jgi:hypothetical protein